MTDGCYGGSKNSINNRGEIAFRYGSVADLQMSIALFTKPSFVADVDFDGDVDLQDFALVQGCFGTDGAGSGNGWRVRLRTLNAFLYPSD